MLLTACEIIIFWNLHNTASHDRIRISSRELQWHDFKIRHQESSHNYSYQGDMPYCISHLDPIKMFDELWSQLLPSNSHHFKQTIHGWRPANGGKQLSDDVDVDADGTLLPRLFLQQLGHIAGNDRGLVTHSIHRLQVRFHPSTGCQALTKVH